MAALHKDAVIGVIGAGSMGAGIAHVAAVAGHPVLLYDSQAGATERARAGIDKDLRFLVGKGKLAADEAAAILARVRPAVDLAEFARCALVIEAVVEDLEVKRGLMRQLQGVVGADCILATNTSSLSVSAVAAGLERPGRVAGMHFFNPAQRMKLVEVVSGVETDAAVAETLFDTAQAWGKRAAYAKSTPGFIVNRIARPFYGEAWRVFQENAGGSDAIAATIDAIARDCGGFPMGPFELMDLIGHDVNLTVTRSVFDATFGERRYAPSLPQQELVRAGRLGRKSGRGIYDYRDGVVRPAPRVEAGADPVSRVVAVGSLGIATPIITRLEQAGVDVVRVQGPAGSGWLDIGPARLTMSDGRPATRRAAEENHPHLVLFDLALDYGTTPRLGLARADSCGDSAFRTACATLARAGFACSPLDDVAGLVVLRTITMLVNEAADAVLYGVCTAEAIDVAMRYGVNYPRGPMEWSEQVGLDFFARVLRNLREHYGEERYRTSALITRLGYTGAGFHG